MWPFEDRLGRRVVVFFRSAGRGQVAIQRPDLSGAKSSATDLQRSPAHADRCSMFYCEANGLGRRLEATRALGHGPSRVAAEEQVSWGVENMSGHVYLSAGVAGGVGQ